MFRAMIAERFPDHDVLAEELGGGGHGTSRYRWVFDPLDGTTNYAHGLPIFCASLALEIDGEAEVAAVYDATRHELFTAERGVGRVAERRAAEGVRHHRDHRRAARDRVSRTTSSENAGAVPAGLRRVHLAGPAPCAGSARRPSTSATSPPAGWTASGKQSSSPGTCAAGALIVQEAGGRVTGLDGRPWDPANGHILASNGAAARGDARDLPRHAEVSSTDNTKNTRTRSSRSESADDPRGRSDALWRRISGLRALRDPSCLRGSSWRSCERAGRARRCRPRTRARSRR